MATIFIHLFCYMMMIILMISNKRYHHHHHHHRHEYGHGHQPKDNYRHVDIIIYNTQDRRKTFIELLSMCVYTIVSKFPIGIGIDIQIDTKDR